MKPLYRKISEAYLVLLVGTTAVLSVSTMRWWYYTDELTSQVASWSVAAAVVDELRPELSHSPVNEVSLKGRLYRLGQLIPEMNLYLLDEQGTIRYTVGISPAIKSVDLAPVKKFLEMRGYPSNPISGDNPAKKGESAPITVARIDEAGFKGYAYIVLRGQRAELVWHRVGDISSTLYALSSLLFILVSSFVLGALLFRLLTRRLSLMTRTLQMFEAGDYQARIAYAGDDEIGTHARAFNAMADTIVAGVDKLRNEDRLRRELVAALSHDLRRPMALAHMRLQVLLERQDGIEREALATGLTQVYRTIDDSIRMLDDLFELSKLEDREAVPDREVFSANEMVSEIAARFVPLAEQAEVTLSFERAENDPDVWGDAAMYRRVLANIVENAIRHTPRGGRVTIRARARDGGKIVIEVIDTGIGIKSDELPLIFSRFYRAQNSQDGGSGLGLAIAKKLIDAHGEQIGVESVVGKGSVFHFTLAILPGAQPETPEPDGHQQL